MVYLLYFPLYVFYTAIFMAFIFRAGFFEITVVKRLHLALFFLLKAVAGLLLTLIYTYYYTDPAKADIYRYFNDSKIISSLLFTHPAVWLKVIFHFGKFDGDTLRYLQETLYVSHPSTDLITSNTLLIKIISLLNYFSFYNIYINTLLFNFITFIALTQLLKVLMPFFEEFPQILYWPLFLLPSVIFWSSGLLKEPLLFIGISLFLGQWLRYGGTWWHKAVISAVGFLMVCLTKVYVGLVLFICTALLPYRYIRFLKQIMLIRVILIAGIFVAGWYYMIHSPVCETILEKRNQFTVLSVFEHSGSAIDTSLVTEDCGHLWSLMPAAICNSVLRPFVWDKGNLLQKLFGLENLFFVVCMAVLTLGYFKIPGKDAIWLAAFCFGFATLNYIGIGLTVPILGAIVHYRVIAMPFLLLSVLLITDIRKLKQHFMRVYSLVKFKA